MNVLAFTYKAEISGGSNRSLLSILEILVKEGHTVTLFLPKRVGGMYEEASRIGASCVYIKYSEIVRRKRKGLLLLIQYIRLYILFLTEWCRAYRLLGRVVEFSPDIIYTNGYAVHMGRMLAKILHKPHVWHIREFTPRTALLPFNYYQLMSNGTSKFILISNDLYNVYLKNVKKEKLVMISNGIKYVEQPPRIPHDCFNLLVTARICEDKRQLDAVEAIHKICDNYNVNDLYLHFAGSPVQNEDILYMKLLKSSITNYGLENKVTFLGEVKDMSAIRQRMDVELLCSSREPFGRVTVEAMRSELCVIASNSGGTKDIVVDGYNGFTYVPGNIVDLCDKIMMLYTNRELLKKVSLNAKEFSKTHFTETQLYKTTDLIQDLAKNNFENE